MDLEMIKQQKDELRTAMSARRKALDPMCHMGSAQGILSEFSFYFGSKSIESLAAYKAFGGEIDPAMIIDWARTKGIDCGLPYLPSDAIPQADGAPKQDYTFKLWREQDELESGVFGVEQPASTAPDMEPQVLLVPLIAFDRQGGRVGRGKGHYDRVIQKIEARGDGLLIGLGFSFQEADPCPMEDHDQRLDAVITPEIMHICSERGRAFFEG
jgi:5-formyltetrahydrofolate cyclo-ligase